MGLKCFKNLLSAFYLNCFFKQIIPTFAKKTHTHKMGQQKRCYILFLFRVFILNLILGWRLMFNCVCKKKPFLLAKHRLADESYVLKPSESYKTITIAQNETFPP